MGGVMQDQRADSGWMMQYERVDVMQDEGVDDAREWMMMHR